MENLLKLQSSSTFRWGLRGAKLSFVLLSAFVIFLGVFGNIISNKSGWETLQQFFPIITGTLGGAVGGLCFGIINNSFNTSGWKKYLIIGIGILAYLVPVWMSLILGFSAIGQWD